MGKALGRLSRAVRTLGFLVFMLVSLIVSCAPCLISLADILITGSASLFALKPNWADYKFRSSIIDIPILSLLRSFIAISSYSLCCNCNLLCYEPYVGTTILCLGGSIIYLISKACLLVPKDLSSSYVCGLLLAFVSSMIFAFGHVAVGLKTKLEAQRRLLLLWGDEEEAVVSKYSKKVADIPTQKMPQFWHWFLLTRYINLVSFQGAAPPHSYSYLACRPIYGKSLEKRHIV